MDSAYYLGIASQMQNHLEGMYVGAFTVEKPFGPHVRKCVCDTCHAAFLAESKVKQAEYEAKQAELTQEQRDEQEAFIMELIAEIRSNPKPEPTPNPAKVKVGDRIIYKSRGTNFNRIGTVVEMPGPSTKYGGVDAQRIEVLLHATADDEWETVWTDNNQYGWLELA